MLNELQREIVGNLIEIISENRMDDIRNIGNIKKSSMFFVVENPRSKYKSLVTSLTMDCKVDDSILNYCVGINSVLLPDREQKYEVREFSIQEQVGTSFGFPIHGNPITEEEKKLLVLQAFNDELEKAILEQLTGKNRTSK